MLLSLTFTSATSLAVHSEECVSLFESETPKLSKPSVCTGVSNCDVSAVGVAPKSFRLPPCVCTAALERSGWNVPTFETSPVFLFSTSTLHASPFSVGGQMYVVS